MLCMHSKYCYFWWTKGEGLGISYEAWLRTVSPNSFLVSVSSTLVCVWNKHYLSLCLQHISMCERVWSPLTEVQGCGGKLCPPVVIKHAGLSAEPGLPSDQWIIAQSEATKSLKWLQCVCPVSASPRNAWSTAEKRNHRALRRNAALLGITCTLMASKITALLALIFTNTNQIIAGLSSQTSIRSTVLVFRGAKLVHWPSSEGVWEGNGRRSLDQSRLRLAVTEKRERLSSAL